MSILTDPDDTTRTYGTWRDRPYLTTDANGQEVILCEETVFSSPFEGAGVDQCYTTDVIIDPNPSEAEKFKYKLRGDVRPAKFGL